MTVIISLRVFSGTFSRTDVHFRPSQVNKAIVLADAGGQDAVLATLREIAKGILAGSFP